MPKINEKRSHHSRFDRQFPRRKLRRVSELGAGLRQKYPDPGGDGFEVRTQGRSNLGGSEWTMRDAAQLDKFKRFARQYGLIAQRFESQDPFMGWPGVEDAWADLRDSMWKLFRVLVVDTSDPRGPLDEWFHVGQDLGLDSAGAQTTVLDIQPAWGWQQFLRLAESHLQSQRGWSISETGEDVVSIVVDRPLLRIFIGSQSGQYEVITQQPETYTYRGKFTARGNNRPTIDLCIQAIIWGRVPPVLILPWETGDVVVDFAAGYYRSAATGFIERLTDLLVLQMRYVQCHLQEEDVTNTKPGGRGGVVGVGSDAPEGVDASGYDGQQWGQGPAWPGVPV